jgi:hypothetical protein
MIGRSRFNVLKENMKNTKLAPLVPIFPSYPSEVRDVVFSAAQLVKIDELLVKVTARAGAQAKREIPQLTKRLAKAQAELRSVKLQLANLTTV